MKTEKNIDLSPLLLIGFLLAALVMLVGCGREKNEAGFVKFSEGGGVGVFEYHNHEYIVWRQGWLIHSESCQSKGDTIK